MEKDNELKGEGNSYDFGGRMYDSRLGRWMSVDPVVKPDESSYTAFSNNPVYFIDPNGESGVAYIEGNTVVVETNLNFYGTQVSKVDVNKIANNIQSTWNAANGTVKIDGREYNVKFKVTAKILSVEDATAQMNSNTSYKENFLRIESMPSSSYNGPHGSNSGAWNTKDALETSTTAPHEYGHLIGLTEYMKIPTYGGGVEVDGYLYENFQGYGTTNPPNIMSQRNSPCDVEGYNMWNGNRFVVDPAKRVVTQENIDDLNLADVIKNKGGNIGFLDNRPRTSQGSVVAGSTTTQTPPSPPTPAAKSRVTKVK